MEYVNTSPTGVAPAVAAKIIEQLDQGKSVLWLLSGGSGGKVCVDASKLLKDYDLSRLYVTFSDERYGEPGHADENYQILINEGLNLPGANIYRPLQGLTEAETVSNMTDWLEDVESKVDFKFAVMGIGADGHTAGVKPFSPAVLSSGSVELYKADDFDRLTVTLNYIKSLDEAIVQAYGQSKHEVVARLLNNDGEIESFPALAIREIPKVTLYSDLTP